MEKKEIEDVAYIFKQLLKVENQNNPKPIVFLGAGASASAGIPMTGKIIEDILKKFGDKPAVKKLSENEIKNYYKVMSALSPNERRKLFYDYITHKDVKLNVTHIYLAQFLQKGLIDYILTVNFDDLMLKSTALFNSIPPVYDISILNDFTTTNFVEKSVTYLHGQHHGQWLLNAEGELQKVKSAIPKIFERICNKRTWIIVGYSGEDEILDEIAKIGSFENELFWIGYKDNDPIERVKTKLLDEPRKNAYLITGYDSDTFFLKLHSEIGLDTPEIFNKPFSFLKSMTENVKDIEYDTKDKHKELFENIKERMDISKSWVESAIGDFEIKLSVEKLKQDIIEARLKGLFKDEVANDFENKIISNEYVDAYQELSEYYNSWGVDIANLGTKKEDEELMELCIDKFKKSIQFNKNNKPYLNNLGLAFSVLARIKRSDSLFEESLKTFRQAATNDGRDSMIYYNWGNALANFAKQKDDEKLFEQSFTKYMKASQIKPSFSDSYNNWGNALVSYANKIKSTKSLKDSFTKFKMALEIKPNTSLYFCNWAMAIIELIKMSKNYNLLDEFNEKMQKAIDSSKQKSEYYFDWGVGISDIARIISEDKFIEKSKNLYYLGLEKYEQALSITPRNSLILDQCASNLLFLSNLVESKNKPEIVQQAKDKAQLSYNIDKRAYNLSCATALLGEKETALQYLEESLVKKQIDTAHILKDIDWINYLEDTDFKKIIKKYS